MRIAVVHSFYTAAQPSGENAVVRQQAAALERAGHDVRLIARHTDDHSAERAYTARAAWATATGHGWTPQAQLEEFGPDVVHVHNTFPNWGTSWAGAWRSRMVLTLHNFRSVCAAGTLFRDGHSCTDCLRVPVLPAVRHGCYRNSTVASAPLAVASSPVGPLRRLAQKAARVIVLNDAARDVMEDALGRPATVVPNFVAPPATTDGQEHPMGWAYVGRLSDEKGLPKLLESWPDTETLDVFGSGPLEATIRASVLDRPNVRVLGQVDSADLLARLAGYRGLVVPSLWHEGLPTVILEALARGVPVVVSDQVAVAKQLETSGAATVYAPSAGPAALHEALTRVSGGGDLMRQAARDLFARDYSEQAWLRRVENIYADVARHARNMAAE